MKLIFIGLDILLLLVLLFFIFVGLKKGFFKRLSSLILTAVPLIMLAVFITPLTNAALESKYDIPNIAVGGATVETAGKSLGEIAEELTTNLIVQYAYEGDASFTASEYVTKTAHDLSFLAAKLVLYIGGLILLLLIIIPLLKLIWKIFCAILGFRGKPRFKLLGLATSLVHFGVIFFFVFMPIYGILEIGSDILTEVKKLPQAQQLPEELDGDINDSFVYKFGLSLTKSKDKIEYSLAGKTVSNLLSFEDGEKKVEIVRDLKLGIKLVPVITEITKNEDLIIKNEGKVEGYNLSVIDDADFDALYQAFEGTTLIPYIMPLAMDVVGYRFGKQDTLPHFDYPALCKLDWYTEIKSLSKLVKTVKDNKTMVINLADFTKSINDDVFVKFVTEITDNILTINVVSDQIVEPVMHFAIDKAAESTPDIASELVELKTINWKEDLRPVLLCLLGTVSDITNVEINKADYKIALKDKDLPDSIKNVLTKISECDPMMDNIFPKIIDIVVSKIKQDPKLSELGIDYDEIGNLTWKNEIESLRDVSVTLVKAYQEVLDTVTKPDDYLSSTKLPGVIKDVAADLVKSNFAKKIVITPLVNMGLQQIESNEAFSKFNLDIAAIKQDLTSTNWDTELPALAGTIAETVSAYQVLDLKLDKLDEAVANDQFVPCVDKIMDETENSNIIRTHMMNGVSNYLKSYLKDFSTSTFNIDFVQEMFTGESIYNLFKNDTEKFVSILRDMKKLGVFNEGGKELDSIETVDGYIGVVKKFYELSIVQGFEQDIFKSALEATKIEESLSSLEITFKYETVTSWPDEIDSIGNVMKKIIELNGSVTSFDFGALLNSVKEPTKRDLAADVISSIADNKIIGHNIYGMMEKLVANVSPDYDITFTDDEKAAIKTNTWKKEVTVLFTIIDDVQSEIDNVQSGSYSSLNADKIHLTMTNASESVIASKILGTALNTAFGDKINYDLTTRENMRNSADSVKNLIVLSQMVSNPTNIDLSKDADADKLIQAVQGITSNEATNELATQFVKDITGQDIVIDEATANASTATITEVIDIYQATEDKESFTLDQLPEDVKADLADSELAKTILDYFFN